MKRIINIVFILIVLSGFACSQKGYCPAYRSAFEHSEEEKGAANSILGGNDLPKRSLNKRKDENGLGENNRKAYRKRRKQQKKEALKRKKNRYASE